MYGRRYSCKRYARSFCIRHRDLFPLRTVAHTEAIGVGIKNFLRISFVASLAHCHFTPFSSVRQGNEIKQVYSTSQKFLHLSFRLESPFNLLNVHSANVKSSVTCVKVFFIEMTLVLNRYVEILEFEKKIDRASFSIIIVFCEHIDLLYIIYYVYYIYTCIMPIQIICSDPSLSCLRIFTRCASWHMQRSSVSNIKNFPSDLATPYVLLSLALSFFLRTSA